MIKASHVVRFEYDETYRQLRLYGGVLDRENKIRAENWIEECAILSYDYHDSQFSGWINRQRLSAFQKRCEQIANWRGWIPF